MNIFPGNVLVIDDQFNICYSDEPEDIHQKTQYKNFLDLKNIFEQNGIQYAAITETSDISSILRRIKQYQNIRLLLLDLDLNESGEIERDDIDTVKKIILFSSKTFGYFFLAINSSYPEKWVEIKDELVSELSTDIVLNKKELNLLNNFSICFEKGFDGIQDMLLDLISKKFSNELITQFECCINNAKDKALGSFLDQNSNAWEFIYKILREDIDSRDQANYTLNHFLLGLIKQHVLNTKYSIPDFPDGEIESHLHKDIIRSFNYSINTDGILDRYPVWTGNLYKDLRIARPNEYCLVLTPECDIAQNKANSYTMVVGYEFNQDSFPKDYKPADYDGNENPPFLIKLSGKTRNGSWKTRSEIETTFKGLGFYILHFASENGNHIILNLRNITVSNDLKSGFFKLISRVNEPIITDIQDRYSGLFNRKGIPQMLSKNYKMLS